MKLDLVVHACNPSYLEAETGSQVRAILGCRVIPGQPGQLIKTLSQNKKKNEGLCLPTVCQALNSVLSTEAGFKNYLVFKLIFNNDIGIFFKF